MEPPATHGATILRAATRKMTSIMNIHEQFFARHQYSNISGYATGRTRDGGTVKGGMRNGMEYVIEHGMEHGMEYGMEKR